MTVRSAAEVACVREIEFGGVLLDLRTLEARDPSRLPKRWLRIPIFVGLGRLRRADDHLLWTFASLDFSQTERCLHHIFIFIIDKRDSTFLAVSGVAADPLRTTDTTTKKLRAPA